LPLFGDNSFIGGLHSYTDLGGSARYYRSYFFFTRSHRGAPAERRLAALHYDVGH
jgi:hypothetical protein